MSALQKEIWRLEVADLERGCNMLPVMQRCWKSNLSFIVDHVQLL